jgi:hypothetical protein
MDIISATDPHRPAWTFRLRMSVCVCGQLSEFDIPAVIFDILADILRFEAKHAR